MNRIDKNGPNPCQAAGQNIGKDLVADHRRSRGLEAHLPHRRPAAPRQRFHGLGHKGSPTLRANGSMGPAYPIGNQAKPNARRL